MNIYYSNNTPYKHLVERLKSWDKLALDIETSGDFKFPHTQTIETIQLCKGLDVIVINARALNPVPLLNIIKDKEIIGHNIKFDWKLIFLKYGVLLSNVRDTMLAHKLLTLGSNKSSSLASLVVEYVNPYAYSNQGDLFYGYITKELRQNFNKTGDLSKEELYYAALDALYTYRLHDILLPHIQSLDLEKAYELEYEVLKPLALMELNGIPINIGAWLELEKINSSKLESLTDELLKVADINWSSDKQVKKVFKSLGINVTFFDKKTGKFVETVNANKIKGIDDPLIKLYLEYKKMDKLVSSYGMKFLENVNPHTGRVHTNFFQLVDTGRTSSSDINLQNIPSSKDFRSCFETKEGEFIIADYSNQEVVIIADRTEDNNLLEAFRRREDVHLWVAKLAFNDETLTKESHERKLAKSMNFLLAYGGGATKLAENFSLSPKIAKNMLNKYYKTFSRLEPTFSKWHKESLEKGYIVIDEYTKRRYFYPKWDYYKFAIEKHHLFNEKILNEIYGLGEEMRRKAQNFRIQGAAASMTKKALILLYEDWLVHRDFEFISMIHDEIMLLTRNTNRVKVLLENKMQEASTFFLNHIICRAEVISSTKWIK